MNIGLVDVDGHGFPNFALMKIASYHKRLGDAVEWYDPLFSRVDRVYASKVFTFTEDYHYFPAGAEVIKGGTGYDFKASLPDEIENILPDYSIYPQYTYALGFLSRGCIRNCPWCVVPRKEGMVRPVDDIERIAGDRKHVVLMDNNFLANDQGFVREQLEKAQRLKLKLDFNQALDARLVTEENAVWLAKTKWLAANGNSRYIRFSCDTSGMVKFCKRAIKFIRGGANIPVIFSFTFWQRRSMKRWKGSTKCCRLTRKSIRSSCHTGTWMVMARSSTRNLSGWRGGATWYRSGNNANLKTTRGEHEQSISEVRKENVRRIL